MHGLISADMVLVNGKIVTVDAKNSVVEAVAVKDGKIIAVGSTKDVMLLVGDETETIELGGRTVLPGIIDSHTHPSELASRFLQVDCRVPPVKRIREILDKVSEKALELGPGRWIKGANFNDSKLEEKRHITRWELDESAPENPMYIVSDTSH